FGEGGQDFPQAHLRVQSVEPRLQMTVRMGKLGQEQERRFEMEDALVLQLLDDLPGPGLGIDRDIHILTGEEKTGNDDIGEDRREKTEEDKVEPHDLHDLGTSVKGAPLSAESSRMAAAT